MATPQTLPTQDPQVSSSEVYVEDIGGSVSFTLSELTVKGDASRGKTNIIELNESFTAFVKITFDQTPLSSLLMCLGTDIDVDFAFEGFGKAVDQDAEGKIRTVKDQFEYIVAYTDTAKKLGLSKGFYEVAATVTVGPVTHECSKHILGYGYIGEFRFQVY